MQSVNEAEFANTTSLSLLFGLCPTYTSTVIVPLTSTYVIL